MTLEEIATELDVNQGEHCRCNAGAYSFKQIAKTRAMLGKAQRKCHGLRWWLLTPMCHQTCKIIGILAFSANGPNLIVHDNPSGVTN